MSYMRSLALACDHCGWWTDFDLQNPVTPRELVAKARKMGWSCSVPRRDPVDLCPTCARGSEVEP